MSPVYADRGEGSATDQWTDWATSRHTDEQTSQALWTMQR